ncbi:hypothetical protein CEP54_003492 [Fusarium duplospermum]|uniref:Uncharacterized protein n=1 Tax=Fusarium duplospermum TaxID=1325734 RepID=A0A428QNU3_9HYPO|nr:hypothetical protein CEP54_003492 [Fusarium duplospermum]
MILGHGPRRSTTVQHFLFGETEAQDREPKILGLFDDEVIGLLKPLNIPTASEPTDSSVPGPWEPEMRTSGSISVVSIAATGCRQPRHRAHGGASLASGRRIRLGQRQRRFTDSTWRRGYCERSGGKYDVRSRLSEKHRIVGVACNPCG